MKRCFIFGALDVTYTPILPTDNDLIMAADKGLLTLKKLGITPDVTVGDFDSLGFVPEEENVIRLNVRKDDTDIGHCINYAYRNKIKNFIIYGASGGKLDHSLGNIQLAGDIANKNGTCIFIGENESFTVINSGKVIFPKNAKGRISVFSLSDSSTVTEKGLSFTANDVTLTRFEPIGISNEFIGKDSEISIKSGELLVVWEDRVLPDIYND